MFLMHVYDILICTFSNIIDLLLLHKSTLKVNIDQLFNTSIIIVNSF